MAAREAEQLAWVNGILARIDKKKKFVISDDEWIQSLGYAYDELLLAGYLGNHGLLTPNLPLYREVARSAVIRIVRHFQP